MQGNCNVKPVRTKNWTSDTPGRPPGYNKHIRAIGLIKSLKPVSEGIYWGTVWWGGVGGVSGDLFVYKEIYLCISKKVQTLDVLREKRYE